MHRFTVEFLGLCETEEHSKLWGWVRIGDDHTLYNFWGGRTKPWTFKRYDNNYRGSEKLERLCRSKTRPRKNGTYVEIPENAIEPTIPGFYEKLEEELCLAKLFDKFHGEPTILSDEWLDGATSQGMTGQ